MATNNQNIGIVCPVPMGEWQASTPYEKLNIVKYNGTTYIAKKSNQNVQPETTSGWTEVWMAIADKGDMGDIGLYHTMSPSSTTVAISSLQPQETTPVVGSAVLFPNGDVRQITAVNSSIITLGDVLFSVKGDPGIGNATLSNTDGDSTEDGFTQAAVKGIAQAKNHYNLGAFDTCVSDSINADIITRQTEYDKLTPESGYWQAEQAPNGLRYYIYWYLKGRVFGPSEKPNINLVANIQIGSPGNTWGDNILEISLDESGTILVKNPDVSSLEEFKEWLYNNPIYIQYKTKTSYTEKVIKNQPIDTLDQNGEQWLREEWQKGLNLFNASLFSATERRLSLLNLKVGEIYTISPPAGHSIKIAPWWNAGDDWGGRMPTINGGTVDGTAPFYSFVYNTTNEGEGWKIFVDAGEKQGSEDLSTYQIMLVKGSHPYPYKPYYGGIVREKDLSGIQLFPTDVNPAQTIGGDWEDKGTVTTSDNTVFHAYRRL